MQHDNSKLADLFQTFSDETRLKIFRLLSDKEVCGCELLENLHVSQPTLSYHMKFMTEEGIVNARKDGAWMRYTLNNDKIDEMVDFLNSLKK